MGIPFGAPNCATLLEMGTARVQVKAVVRALTYWAKLRSKPESHILSDCLKHQQAMMDKGMRPWLSRVKSILEVIGLGQAFMEVPGNLKLFKLRVQERVMDISFSDLLAESRQLASLRGHYAELKLNTMAKTPEKYLSRPLEERRLFAILRLNLRYSLPLCPINS